ncbi:MAG: tetratricopeptide repeat protein [Magnetococcales bacterium]|nr:tetratricopeptide repeat protein [Magnetococcales bacterium]
MKEKGDAVSSAFAPVAVTIFLALVGWLGLKRTELYDSEMSRMREEMDRRGTEIRESAKERIEGIAGTYMAKQFDRRKKDVVDELNRLAGEIKDLSIAAKIDIDERINEVDGRLQRFGWLGKLDLGIASSLEEGRITSAGMSHEVVARLFAERKVPQAIAAVRQVLSDSNVVGSPDDWFNLSAELGRQDQEALALQACERGLEFHPRNVDLLSHAVQFASKVGDFDKARGFYNSLMQIGCGEWNWRAFVFVGDYLEAIGEIDKAFEININFRERIPSDERAYSQTAMILKKLGRLKELVALCKEGMKRVPRAPQLGLILSGAYNELGEHEKAIEATDVGLEGAAEAQPSASQAAILFERACAFDALAVRRIKAALAEGIESEGTIGECLELARKAAVNYRAARGIPVPKPPVYEMQRQARLVVLNTFLTELGVSEDRITETLGESAGEGMNMDQLRSFGNLLSKLEESSNLGADVP